jgi:hypothetical protein
MANVYIFLIVNDRSSIVIPEVRHLEAHSERGEEVEKGVLSVCQ